MYCIYQLDDKMNESIIELLSEWKDFLESVKKKSYSYAKLVECMSVDDVRVMIVLKKVIICWLMTNKLS